MVRKAHGNKTNKRTDQKEKSSTKSRADLASREDRQVIEDLQARRHQSSHVLTLEDQVQRSGVSSGYMET